MAEGAGQIDPEKAAGLGAGPDRLLGILEILEDAPRRLGIGNAFRRCTRRMPSRSSRRAMILLTADGARPSLRAAAEKSPSSTTVRKMDMLSGRSMIYSILSQIIGSNRILSSMEKGIGLRGIFPENCPCPACASPLIETVWSSISGPAGHAAWPSRQAACGC
jgi:hypothetical protein